MNKMEKNAFNIWKTFKPVWNGNAGAVFLMILAATCHRFRDIHPILENGSVFLVFLGFLSLVVVEGKNLVSKWNKSGKRGFLTLGNIIGLVFLGVLLAVGMYATFIIFYVKDFLTIDFLGIFGIIWTLRWIQKLKNFSSTRNSPYKLIGPLIAIIILISGYALHSKNTAFGPFSCVLAPATIWIFSLIFGDIKGRSNDQDDEINPFAIIISVVLLGLVIYAIRNPDIYGIKVMDVDGQFFKDLYDTEVSKQNEDFKAMVDACQKKIDKTQSDIKQYTTEFEAIEGEINALCEERRGKRSALELLSRNVAANNNGNSEVIERINARINEIGSQLEEKKDEHSKIINHYFSLVDRISQERLEMSNLEKVTHLSYRIEKLDKLRDTYAKPRSGTTTQNTIMSWLRRTFGWNKEEINAK